MDDPRWEPGMPVLDRQAGPETAIPAEAAPGADAAPRAGATLPVPPRSGPPRFVPETAPTPLQKHYVMLSVVVFLCGAVAITALEFGTPIDSPLVKLCALIGAPILVVTTADAILRIWRSAWAWLPVNRGRGLFRLAWVAVALVGLLALVAGACAVLVA